MSRVPNAGRLSVNSLSERSQPTRLVNTILVSRPRNCSRPHRQTKIVVPPLEIVVDAPRLTGYLSRHVCAHEYGYTIGVSADVFFARMHWMQPRSQNL